VERLLLAAQDLVMIWQKLCMLTCIFLISQVPGVPIMYITRHRYSIERLPEATVGGGMQYVPVLDILCFPSVS
jgi:hypothetical protein